MKILLITPPLTQLNTPYPATAYLKKYLTTLGHNVAQLDLGIELISQIFTSQTLSEIFKIATESTKKTNSNIRSIIANQHRYITTIDAVMQFLRGNDPTLAVRICNTDLLPQATRFDNIADLDWAFGTVGLADRAKHLATLYIEDITDMISTCINPHFGLNRYAEKLGSAIANFEVMVHEAGQPENYIDKLMLTILNERITNFSPQIVAFSIPFPGNLYAAVKCGQYIKNLHPSTIIVWGGGFVNTELRQLSDASVFHFTDYVLLDDGESSFTKLIEYIETQNKDVLHKTFLKETNNSVQLYGANSNFKIPFSERAIPDYSGLPLDKYISMMELSNPMHKLWSDGRWNKLVLAHGCYWAKCAFCDTSLPYIANYEPLDATRIVDTIEMILKQTHQTGFHFVDEAAPPKLLREISEEIIARKLVVSWWTNIRFERAFSPELCSLMARAGCIAVSGGIEVATDRLLKVINKGVTVEQAAISSFNFTNAGIMTHAYLMYGFPTQTEQETIDGLEIVRQMFENGLIQSAFWHRYAMTVHSPSGMFPKNYGATCYHNKLNAFSNNEIAFTDNQKIDFLCIGEGLRKATFNYMHGLCFDWSVTRWFQQKVPKTTIKKNYIQAIINS